MIGITYTTTDGRAFDRREAAEKHQALVNKIDAWLEAHCGGDTARYAKRELLLALTAHYGNTVTGDTEHTKPTE